MGFIYFRCLQFICFDCVIYSGDVSMKGNGLVNIVIVGCDTLFLILVYCLCCNGGGPLVNVGL